ncbi:MAG TPA: hypothetical protein VHU84_01940 [Lacipirellulaceae bacterium]|nr:hypothetical protein [Lacipirellulaceae bacterium]
MLLRRLLLQAAALHVLLVQVLLPRLLLQTTPLHVLQLQMVLSRLLLQTASVFVLPEVYRAVLLPRSRRPEVLQRTGGELALASRLDRGAQCRLHRSKGSDRIINGRPTWAARHATRVY